MRKLIIVDDEGRRTNVPLVRSEVTVGRAEGNTIRLVERNVSRRHLRIFRNGDTTWVEDTSRYGTRLNGAKISGSQALKDGDVLMVGSYRIELVVNAEEAAVPEVAAASVNDQIVLTPAPPPPPGVPPRASAAPGGPRARLVCMSEPYMGLEFMLNDDELSIGVAPDCDLIMEHRSVAQHHALFTWGEDGYELSPMDAGYPVAVNGRYNPHGPLRAGDEVLLGELKFRFALPGEQIGFIRPTEIDDSEVMAGRPRWLIPALAGGVAVIILLLVVFLRPSGESPSVGTATAPASTPSAEPAPADGASINAVAAEAFARGEAHMEARRWQEAKEAFESIPREASNYEEARQLLQDAEMGAREEEGYRLVQQRLDNGEYGLAWAGMSAMTEGSVYRALSRRDGTYRRIGDGLLDEAIATANARLESDNYGAAAGKLENFLANQVYFDDHRERAEQELERVNQAIAAREQAAAAREAEPRRDEPRPATVRDRGSRGASEPASAPAAATAEPAAAPAASEADRRAQAEELRTQAGRLAAIQQDYREAVRLLEQARRLNAGDSRINLALFTNYDKLRNYPAAAAALRRYLRQVPNAPRRLEYEAWLSEHAP